MYPLSGLLYCAQCGKRLRAQKSPSGKRYYHCANPVEDQCTKRMVLADTLENQVARTISGIRIPENWRTENHPSAESYAQSNQCQTEIQRSLERLDFRWDMGFIEKTDYLAKRKCLQQQLQHNQPIAEQELIEAEKLLRQFKSDWEGGDLVRRKELLNALVESIQVTQGTIQAIRLHARFTYLVRHTGDVKIDAEGYLVTQVAQ